MTYSCFKTYDIRGHYPDQINEEMAYKIAYLFAQQQKPQSIVIGSDSRPSSPGLKKALIQGLMDYGVCVIDLGYTGSEEVYFASYTLKADGGIQVTASHNPIQDNGIKFIGGNTRPISYTTGLCEIEKALSKTLMYPKKASGQYLQKEIHTEYINYLIKNWLSFSWKKSIKVLLNPCHGAIVPLLEKLQEQTKALHLPIQWAIIHNTLEPSFPLGIPNPYDKNQQSITSKAVIQSGADFGVLWDTDFDRCFILDEKGQPIENYYIIGLLTQLFLNKNKTSTIIHDQRLCLNTLNIIQQFPQAKAVSCFSGHSIMKDKMRETQAIYGAENSGHHYFKAFHYCDSGLIPIFCLIEKLQKHPQPLSQLISKMSKRFQCIQEKNYHIEKPHCILNDIKHHYQEKNAKVCIDDGLNIQYLGARFNIRESKTENLLRLNIEVDQECNTSSLQSHLKEIETLILKNT